MTGKADINKTEIDALKELQRKARESSNMRRERVTGSQLGVPFIDVGGSNSGGGESASAGDTPVIVNVVDTDLTGTNTTIFDRVNYLGNKAIIIDNPTSVQPAPDIHLKYLQANVIPDGAEVKIKVRVGRRLIIDKNGNIVIPEGKDIFILNDDTWVFFKYYKDAILNTASWVISGTQKDTSYEINHGRFPITGLTVDISWGTIYVNPPIVILSYGVKDTTTTPGNLVITSFQHLVGTLGYGGIRVFLSGSLPSSPANHFINVMGIAKI